MKKLLLVFLSTLFLFGCSSNDDDSTTSNNSFNPPSWIHGTWGIKADGVAIFSDIPTYRFTSDNICQLSGGINSICWKETIQQFPKIYSGSDSKTNSTYDVSLIQGNGAITTTLKFKKVSDTKIIAETIGGNLELEKLN